MAAAALRGGGRRGGRAALLAAPPWFCVREAPPRRVFCAQRLFEGVLAPFRSLSCGRVPFGLRLRAAFETRSFTNYEYISVGRELGWQRHSKENPEVRQVAGSVRLLPLETRVGPMHPRGTRGTGYIARKQRASPRAPRISRQPSASGDYSWFGAR